MARHLQAEQTDTEWFGKLRPKAFEINCAPPNLARPRAPLSTDDNRRLTLTIPKHPPRFACAMLRQLYRNLCFQNHGNVPKSACWHSDQSCTPDVTLITDPPLTNAVACQHRRPTRSP